jgi:chorismate dehydratase
MYVLGSVPYLNARPLIRRFEVEDRGALLRFDAPSRLPAMLDSGQADAVLVSSIEALRTPGRRMASGVCIGSDGPVRSVRLFSRVPLGDIRALALDASSLTSNRLALVLLAELYGARPRAALHSPGLREMLSKADACVLIGDQGMRADGSGLFVLDLGEAWTRLTGLPFVWAAWIGGARLTPVLAGELRAAAEWAGFGRALRPWAAEAAQAWVVQASRRALCAPARAALAAQTVVDAEVEARREALLRDAAARDGWDEALAREYLDEAMVYRLDERALAGLCAFQSRLLAHGFDDCAHFPALA